MTEEYRALLKEWLRGNQSAIEFIETIFTVLHTVDDCTDRDKPVSTNQLHDAFWHALITLPRNEFYAANFVLLNGSLQSAILNWHAANRMEVAGPDSAKDVAFVLRSSYNDLITLCAYAIGGREWSQRVAYEARLHAGREGKEKYLESLTKERRQAQLVEE